MSVSRTCSSCGAEQMNPTSQVPDGFKFTPHPELIRCDKCGCECYDFEQWLGGVRTCLSCSVDIHAVEACMLACPGCLAELGLVDGDGSGVKTYHPDTDEHELTPCLAIRIRRRHALGDGALVDWIADLLSEKRHELDESDGVQEG